MKYPFCYTVIITSDKGAALIQQMHYGTHVGPISNVINKVLKEFQINANSGVVKLTLLSWGRLWISLPLPMHSADCVPPDWAGAAHCSCQIEAVIRGLTDVEESMGNHPLSSRCWDFEQTCGHSAIRISQTALLWTLQKGH